MNEFLATAQNFPMVGALVAGVMALLFYLGNGLKEKREGRREGIQEERTRQAEASAKVEREIRETSRDAEATSDSVRAGSDYSDRRVREPARADTNDWLYRD